MLATRAIAQGFPVGRPLVSPDEAAAVLPGFLGDYAIQYWTVDLAGGRAQRRPREAVEFSTHVGGFLPDGRLLVTACEGCTWMGPGQQPAPLRTDFLAMRPDGVRTSCWPASTTWRSSSP